MRDHLVELRSDDGHALWDLAAAPRPSAETPAPPRFLARWDSVPLAHEPKRRTRILPTQYQSRVFTRNADVLPTFLVEGTVAGTRDVALVGSTARLNVRPFRSIARDVQVELVTEGDRLVRFMVPDAARHEVDIGPR